MRQMGRLHGVAVLVTVAIATSTQVNAVDRDPTASRPRANPVINTEYGPVEGETKDDVYVFHSVPFAAKPVGDRRWQAPQPPENWTTPVDGRIIHKACPQLDFVRFEYFGEEDCLYMSIYAPSWCTAASPCPVLQWVYGGAWIFGSNTEYGMYDGLELAKRYGVVVVAANYRLDALGWLALDELATDSGSVGNYGLQDQSFAMQWTQRNAKYFGGDPNKVTIFGESAGAYSVCQHLTRPKSNGLFSHAIVESGGCDGPALIFDGVNSKAWSSYYAEKIGCPPTANPDDRVACLKKKSISEILEPYLSWFCPFDRPNNPWCNRTVPLDVHTHGHPTPPDSAFEGTWPDPRPPLAPIVGWAATVDGTPEGLPDFPYHDIMKGRINRAPDGSAVSVIMGTNLDEMAAFIIGAEVTFPGVELPMSRADITTTAHHLVSYVPTWNTTNADSIIAAYTSGSLKGAHPAYSVVALGTDFCFRCTTRFTAAALAHAGVNTWVYEFDFQDFFWRDPADEACQLESEVDCGVFHTAEIKYVFGHENEFFGKQKVVAGLMGSWWTALASHGDPNKKGGSGPNWPMYSAATPSVMYINEHAHVSSGGPSDSRCDVWAKMPPYP